MTREVRSALNVVNATLVIAALGGRDHRTDICPFILGQATAVAQFAAAAPPAVLRVHIVDLRESDHPLLNQKTIQKI
jgi:hypothetical protein